MPGDTKQEKSAAPAKPSAGPKRPSVMLGGFHRSSLRAMTAFGVAGLTGVLLAVGGVGYWRMAASVADLERAQYGQLAMDVRARVEHLVNRDRSRLKEAAFAN